MPANKSPQDKRLEAYEAKRKAGQTPEPFGGQFTCPGAFAVHHHSARSNHYDLRLEWKGTLLSWAIPRGFSLDPQEKKLAVRTEDHPVEYIDFEGIIPEGSYGAGPMILWDRGRRIALEDFAQGLENGKLLFELQGYKLQGVWTLVKTKEPKEWLLIKKPDPWKQPPQEDGFDETSVLSGLSVAGLLNAEEKRRDMGQALSNLESLPPLDDLRVMLAETFPEPFSHPDWIFEVKYDGYRLLAFRDGNRITLRYRSGKDATRFFPEITRALAALPYQHFCLDGEVVLLGPDGRPSFQTLQKRARRQNRLDIQISMVESPATYFAFDLLGCERKDLRPLSVQKRKAFLKEMLPRRGPIRFAEHFEAQGEALFLEVEKLGLEGIVAKEKSSPYLSGSRDARWRKIPALRHDFFVIVGYTESPSGGRSFGALHLAAYAGEALQYAGRVGSGFSQETQTDLIRRFKNIETAFPPFSEPHPGGAEHHWLEPKLVCKIRYKEFTSDGLLRQPVFCSMEEEIVPQECRHPESASEPDFESEEKRLHLTNLEKVFWPEQDFRKKDLIEYYETVAEWMLPYLRDRPLVMDRYPDGIHGKSFFQKNAPDFIPSWIRTEEIWSENRNQSSLYVICDDEETLRYLANLATIPIHIWGSRLQSLERPDWCILDLDPTEAPFEYACEAARHIRTLTEEVSLPSFLKTSGSKGLHVLIPTGARYTFAQVKLLAELLARLTVHRLPEITSIERMGESRKNKIYIDYVQNGTGKLLVAPFSVRPLPEAPISTPLEWEELEEPFQPCDFTIETVPRRFKEKKADPLRPVLDIEIDLAETLRRLEPLVSELP